MKAAWFSVFWLAFGSMAQAVPVEALPPLPRRFFAEAEQLETAGDLAAAALRYEKVAELEPDFTQTLVAWGRCLEASEAFEAALSVYRRAPYDVDVLEALARLQIRRGQYDEAVQTLATLGELAPTEQLAPMLTVVAKANLDVAEAVELLEAYSHYPVFDASAPEVREAVTAIVSRLEGEDVAVEEALLSLPLEEVLGAEVQEALRHVRIRQMAREWARVGVHQLQAEERRRLNTARAALGRGDFATADDILGQFSDAAQRNPEVQVLISEILEASGDIRGAEEAARRATRLGPSDSRYLLRYADLLKRYHAGRYDGEAVGLLMQALSLQPNSTTIIERLAVLESRRGNHEAAKQWYERLLNRPISSEQRSIAMAYLGDLRRELPAELLAERGASPPPGVPEKAWLALHIAYLYQQPAAVDASVEPSRREEDLQRALSQLAVARELAPELVSAINLEGAIYVEQGELARANNAYSDSLRLMPDQPHVLTALAEVETRSGRTEVGEELMARAAAAGDTEALYALAVQHYSRWEVLETRRLLQRYFASPASDLRRDQALELQRDVEWILRVTTVGGLSLLGLVGLAIAVRVRTRRETVTAEELILQFPELTAPVIRGLASIRHEVIKHNTTALAALAESYDTLDPDAIEHVLSRIFGVKGALDEYDRYVDEIRQLAAGKGMGLDVISDNTALGHLSVAMEQLRAMAPMLDGQPTEATLVRLAELAQGVNGSGYDALGRLLTSLALLRVDSELLDEVCTDARDLGQREGSTISIQIPSRVIWVRVLRDDMRLALVNVCRNALRLSEVAGERDILLSVAIESDFVTGLETVCFRVCDRVAQPLTTEMIRSGYIERGLGLAVDAVQRNGGTIAVESVPDWQKAVAIRFPRVERSDT